MKQVSWLTSISKQRPKSWINDSVIEDPVDTGVDVTIISSESWHLNWPLQDVNVQLLGIRTLSHVKQKERWVDCIGLERHREN